MGLVAKGNQFLSLAWCASIAFVLAIIGLAFNPGCISAEAAEIGETTIYVMPFDYMDAILVESDGHFGA